MGRLLRSLALFLGASGVVVLAMQALGWFREGVWTSPTLLDLWLWLGNSYSLGTSDSVHRIVLRLLDLPLGLTLLLAALALLVGARRLED
jgi:hypothetical protein